MLNNQLNIPPLEDVRQKIEDYETTILAIRAFQRVVNTYIEQSQPNQITHFCIGRGMTTSDKNRVKVNNKVTPDLVIQVGNAFGFVLEAKKSLPRNSNNRWRQTISQLEKYDDNLKGWWTKNGCLPTFNLTLLIDVDRSIDFARYIQDRKSVV